MYLLDTNVVIEMLRGNRAVIEKIYSVGIANCCISEMSIAELYYGAVKGNKEKKAHVHFSVDSLACSTNTDNHHRGLIHRFCIL